MSEKAIDQDVVDITDTGATESTETPPVVEEKSISNSEAKKLPWVQDLIQQAAELKKLKDAQAESASMAEQEKLKAAGEWEKALEIERKKFESLSSQYKSDVLKAEMKAAGMLNADRNVKLFLDEYQPDTESAADFVAKIKADEQNAMYFQDPKTRNPMVAPVPSGGGQAESYDPSWIHSEDPAKRQVAISKNKKEFWKQYKTKK